MMRNKFNGTCYKCGLPVEVGTGHFERHNGSWRTQHALHPGRGRVTCAMAEKIAASRSTLARGEAILGSPTFAAREEG